MSTQHPEISATPLRYRSFPGLDGMRAIAVLLVLIFHFFPKALPGGFLGVDVFFTISGFLITSLLLREHSLHGRIRLLNFWQRRARRLLPALFLMLLVCTAIAAIFRGDLLLNLRGQLLATATFISNWFFVSTGADYFTQDAPELFRNSWSLGVEEQFYLLLPLLMLSLLRRPSKITQIGALAGLSGLSVLTMSVMSLSGVPISRIYFGSDTHSFGLFLGALLAVVLHQAPTPERLQPSRLGQIVLSASAGIAILGLLIFAFVLREDAEATFEGGILGATAFSLIAIAAVTRDGSLPGRLLDNRVFRYIGERSYGIYLWHWPLLTIANYALGSHGLGWSPLAIAILVGALTFGTAHLSYRFIEQPVRQRGIRGAVLTALRPMRNGPRGRLTLAAVAALLVVCIPATGFALQHQPAKSEAQLAIERGEKEAAKAAAAAKKAAEKAEQTASAKPASQVDPATPLLPSGSQITAVGDSVMLASQPELLLAFPGIEVDAAVSRGMSAGLSIVEDLRAQGKLRQVVVLGLGTNGYVTEDDVAYITELSKTHQVVLVNGHAERDWIPGTNQTIADTSARLRGVALSDWDSKIAPHPELLAGDGIHPSSAGGKIYSDAVRDALQQLASAPAELPTRNLPRF